MENEEKLTFDISNFEKEWSERLENEDTDVVSKLTKEDKEFARGFYYALSCLDNRIANEIDDINSYTDTLDKIRKEIIEDAGEHIKSRMSNDFEELFITIVESHC